jgi:WD40 repeat protein/uncharacterized caspase-like protein
MRAGIVVRSVVVSLLLPGWLVVPPAAGQIGSPVEAQVIPGHEDDVRALAFSSDGSYLASGGSDEMTLIWQWQTSEYTARQRLAMDRVVNGLVFSPDGKLLYIGADRLRDLDNALEVWSVGQSATQRKLVPSSWNCDISSVAAAGKRIVVGLSDNSVRVIDAGSFHLAATMDDHREPVLAVALAKDGQLFASGSTDEAVRLGSAITGTSLAELTGHSAAVRAVAFHPKGKILASADADGVIRLWSVDSRTETKRLTGSTEAVYALAFSPDGKHLAGAGEDKVVHIWSVDTGSEEASCAGHISAIYALAWHPKGQMLASAGGDKTIRIWRLNGAAARGPVIAEEPTEPAAPPPAGGAKPAIVMLNPPMTRGMKLVQDKASLTIRGKVAATSPLTQVTVNGKNARLAKNNEFSAVVALEPGDNILTIRAKDRKGRSYEETVTITREEVETAAPIVVGLPRKGRDYALLIAVNEYDEWQELTNPVPDARAVETELRTSYGFQAELVTNPSQVEMLSAFRKYAAREYEEGDQLFIFVAGHGQFDEILGDGYIVARDSRLRDDIKTSYVSHSTLRTIINNIPCKHIFLVVDACFGGTFDPLIAMRDRGGDEYAQITKTEFIERKMKFRTRRFLTSGGKVYVSDGRPGQHSPFTRRLLDALRSYGGKDGILTIGEILLYVEKVSPEPRAGEFGNNEPGSDFLFLAR